jgi:hypothetical protein
MSDQTDRLLHNLAITSERQLAISRFKYYEEIKAAAATSSPKSLIAYGQKIYSQNDEDGIIAEIFTRIGTTNKVFVEFGVGNGLECNTRALLFSGWKGLWIEGDQQQVNAMQQQLPSAIEDGRLSVLHAFITKDNINALITSRIAETEIDLLSVDIDGNDCHVLSEISCVKPRVIVIEYNAKFPPPLQYCQQYQETHRWKGTDDFGASISFLDNALNAMGYRLVACDIAGVNAFFVREDLVADRFHAPCNALHHYQPARYFLLGLTSGHPASNATIENALQL